MKGILVFASNTDCGKTLVSAGLARAAVAKGLSCSYFKPVQTGVLSESDTDAYKVKNWSGIRHAETLLRYRDAVSPHLAAQKESRIVPAFEIREMLGKALTASQSQVNIVETAGGVLSPFPDETLAADVLQLTADKLNLRVVLVGDSKLGGISQTFAALEALEARRYDVCSMILFATDDLDQRYGNVSYLKKRLLKNPPVRQIMTPIPPEGAQIPNSFFDNSVFSEVLSDALDLQHDKRSI